MVHSLLAASAVLSRVTGYAAIAWITSQTEPDLCPWYGLILASDILHTLALVGLWAGSPMQIPPEAGGPDGRI